MLYFWWTLLTVTISVTAIGLYNLDKKVERLSRELNELKKKLKE